MTLAIGLLVGDKQKKKRKDMKTKIKHLFNMNDDTVDVVFCTLLGIGIFAEAYALIWFFAIIS